MMLRALCEDDVFEIEPQASQPLGSADRWRILRESVPRGPCWTYVGAGRVLGIGGFVHLHEEWATAWTILAGDIGAAMVGLTRAVAPTVRDQQDKMGPLGRLDMHVDPASMESARWAAMLGFRFDAWLERALPGGRPMTVWLYQGGLRG